MQFLEKITEFSVALVGGAALSSDWKFGSMKNMASKSYGALRGIQQRGMGITKKHGLPALRSGASLMKSIGKGAGHALLSRGRGAGKVDDSKPAGDHLGGAARTSIGDHAGSSSASAKAAIGDHVDSSTKSTTHVGSSATPVGKA